MHWGDERAIFEGTMTGGLGQRSSSTGSLQWLQQQQQSFVIASTTPPLNLRKVSKVGAIPPSRERFGFWICRMVVRRKASMYFLFLVSIFVFVSLWRNVQNGHNLCNVLTSRHISDEDRLEVHDMGSQSLISSERPIADRQKNSHDPTGSPDSAYVEISPKIDVNLTAITYNNTPMRTLVIQNTIHPPAASADHSLPPGHRCQQFTLPPPPADKKRTGPRPCPVCYLPVEEAIKLLPAVPSPTPVLKNLTYVTEVVSSLSSHGSSGSDFGGYPTLNQRNDSFNIQESMHVHCGFVKGSTPGNATGFDFDKEDLSDMYQCRGIVVASAIFGNYDELQQPKNISEKSKRDICFFMFVDETTESFLRKTAALNNSKRIGLWRVVVVHKLPYSDARRNGKIPKLLLHRLFPNVRFSLWIDGKLELVVDPYQILERFLWRTGDTFAISKHYRRFDVFDEAQANKAAGKYNNASIDAQVEFYRKEGLTHYSPSKLPITSDVPEGCVIIKEHTPITNLFTCLWFNEVDRFTSRDQISFAIVRDKMMARVNWRVNMFLDCERRNFVVQAYHRDILERRTSRMSPLLPRIGFTRKPSDEPTKKSSDEPTKKSSDEPTKKSSDDKVPEKAQRSSGRRGSSRHKERRSVVARHRKVKIGSKGAEFS